MITDGAFKAIGKPCKPERPDRFKRTIRNHDLLSHIEVVFGYANTYYVQHSYILTYKNALWPYHSLGFNSTLLSGELFRIKVPGDFAFPSHYLQRGAS